MSIKPIALTAVALLALSGCAAGEPTATTTETVYVTDVPDDLPTDVIDDADIVYGDDAVEDEFMTTALTVQAVMTAANECEAALAQAVAAPGYETDDQVFLDAVESTNQACSEAWSNVPATGDGHLDAAIDIWVDDMGYAAFAASIADPANPSDMNITRDAMITATDTRDLVMDLIANWSEDTSADLGLGGEQ